MSAVRRTVETVNSLGPVDWMDAGQLFATNFRAEYRATRAVLELYSRRVRLQLPGPVGELQIWTPGFAPEDVTALTIRPLAQPGDQPILQRAKPGEVIAVPAGSALEVGIEGPPGPDSRDCRPLRVPLRLALRRILSETRDRLRL